MVSPAWALKDPLLFAPAEPPNAVGTDAVKIPVLAPVSARITVSVSPLLLVRVMATVSAAAGLAFRSESTRVTAMAWPGRIEAVEDRTAVPPPETIVVAVTVAVVPDTVSASL